MGADDDDEDDLRDDRHYEDLRGDAGDDLGKSRVPLAGAHREEGLGVPDAVTLVEQDGEEFAPAVLKCQIPNLVFGPKRCAMF